MNRRRIDDFFRTVFLGLLIFGAATSLYGQKSNAKQEKNNSVADAGVSAPEPVLSGLMLGHVTYREARLWIQTEGPAEVVWELWPETDSENRKKVAFTIGGIETENGRGMDFFTGILTATLLEPATRYNSRLLLNGAPVPDAEINFNTSPVWQFESVPPTIRLAMGSCTYINESGYDRPGKPYGSEYEIFDAILQKQPDAMFWLGDNTYLRDPDFTSKSGVYHRYAHTRATPEMQKLLRAVPNYAIWDDHDFGPNDADRSFVNKDYTLSAFRDFWANPGSGTEAMQGTMTRFSWVDLDLFLLDNRWYRSPNRAKTVTATILGQEQENWLIESLVTSKATFKLVLMGGQLLNTAQVWETYANIAPEERQRILDRIDREGIKGVVFVSGDRHHSEISRLDLPGGQWIYDITISPLTAGAHKPQEENNTLRIPGSLVEQHNFGLLEVSGEKEKRVLTVQYIDHLGQSLFEHRIQQPDFRTE